MKRQKAAHGTPKQRPKRALRAARQHAARARLRRYRTDRAGTKAPLTRMPVPPHQFPCPAAETSAGPSPPHAMAQALACFPAGASAGRRSRPHARRHLAVRDHLRRPARAMRPYPLKRFRRRRRRRGCAAGSSRTGGGMATTSVRKGSESTPSRCQLTPPFMPAMATSGTSGRPSALPQKLFCTARQAIPAVIPELPAASLASGNSTVGSGVSSPALPPRELYRLSLPGSLGGPSGKASTRAGRQANTRCN